MATTQDIENAALTLSNRAKTNVSASELHADILCRIFLTLRDIHEHERRENGNWHFTGEKWNWKVVSMVCRHWRLIAVEYPSLWTKIRDFRSLDQIRVYLERSGQAELDVHTKVRSFDRVEMADLLKRHIWRFRVFKIAASRTVLDSMVYLLSELTHHAKALDMQVDVISDDIHKETDYSQLLHNSPVILPSVQLVSLSLNGFALPWSCSLYHGLRELIITDVFTADVYKPSIWQFIDVLKHCPNLQHLELYRFSPLFGDTRISEIEERRLRFPQLRSIELEFLPPQICSKILAIFTIGANVDLDVRLFLFPREVAGVFVYDPMHLPSNMLIERIECRSINILFKKDLAGRTCTIQAYRGLDLDTGAGSRKTSILTELDYSSARRVAIPLLQILVKDRFYQSAEEITIIFEIDTYVADPVLWGSLLNDVPKSIRRLSITFDFPSAKYIQHDFGLYGALLARTTDGQMILPNLEQITIFYKEYPPGFVAERRSELFGRMEERRKLATRACRASILDQQINPANSTLYTAVQSEHVFTPISTDN